MKTYLTNFSMALAVLITLFVLNAALFSILIIYLPFRPENVKLIGLFYLRGFERATKEIEEA